MQMLIKSGNAVSIMFVNFIIVFCSIVHSEYLPKGVYNGKVFLNDSLISTKITILSNSQIKDVVEYPEFILLNSTCSYMTYKEHELFINNGIVYRKLPYKEFSTSTAELPCKAPQIKLSSETVTDLDGNVYHTVKIGNQTWTVENWICSKFNNGTPIPHVTDSATWENLTTPGYCFYNNSTDTAYKRKWGALYNWYAVATGNLAPKGWHVPTADEWTNLEKYLIANGYNWDGTKTDNKIGKALAAQTDWRLGNQAGTIGAGIIRNNRSGFSALPAGFRISKLNFCYQGSACTWWSISEMYSWCGCSIVLSFESEKMAINDGAKVAGCPVRILKD